ncbi:MAG TPA: DUF1553 domain-containing protein [Pirellulaceae bacterium]|nr:DUF1553 domain-containing protein [Pirellulaceae bacterium]
MRLIASLCTVLVLAGPAVRASADEPLSFERHIRPILKAHCFQCHGEEGKQEGNLDVRLKRLLEKGGDSGAAIVPGKPDESLLLERLKAGEMPPEKKQPVSAADIERITQWIAAGAPVAATEPDDPSQISDVTADEKAWWSFQPIGNPVLPSVRHTDRLQSAPDAFVLAMLEKNQFTYAPKASPVTLIRRATFDLTGLPPLPEEIDAFVADAAATPDAYERLVDRLLASPAYGERWGRHWLDVAGYADSDGYAVEDRVRPYAYKYRDYVIRALNADRPWDRMIVEQLAGDELVPLPHQNLNSDQIDMLAATGYLRMAPDGTQSDPDQKTARNAVVADTLKIVSTSLVGLTVGCAQCHNHRYDPIPQADYYRLRAIFEPALDVKDWRKPADRLVSLFTDADRATAAEVEAEAKQLDDKRKQHAEEIVARILEEQLAKLPEDKREEAKAAREAKPKERTDQQKALLKQFPSVNVSAGSIELYDRKAANELKEEAKQAAEVRAKKPVEDFLSILSEVPGKIPATVLFHRGDPDQPKQQLAPGELSVLSDLAAAIPLDDPSLPTSGRRLAYARHLTSGKHPLVARVLVNRFWMHHFGRGLVATPGEFGRLGEIPSHPELLDWLAGEFMFGGWELKRLQRRMVSSAAYRQGSGFRVQGSGEQRSEVRDQTNTPQSTDPDNRLLWRFPVRRLEAEAVRDAALAASGQLIGKQFGTPVPVMIDSSGQVVLGIEMLDGEGNPSKQPAPLAGEDLRRSVYIQVRRSRPLGTMEAFDLPTLEPNCDLRTFSTVTPQSLVLMNSEFVVDVSEAMAARLARDAGSDLSAQLRRGWQLAFGRMPSEQELSAATAFVQDAAAQFTAAPPATDPKAPPPPSPEERALALFCQTLLSSNEFLYLD